MPSLVGLIKSGRIRNLEELRATYHALVMRTHPDAVGSDRMLSKFLQLAADYEEARDHLRRPAQAATSSSVPVPASEDHRMEFYRQLRAVESWEVPYAFHPEENQERIKSARQKAAAEMKAWNPGRLDNYLRADEDHRSLKMVKPSGPYLKDALALNLRPVFHNITAFHVTGRDLYARQSRQNKDGILHQLRVKGCLDLVEFLEFLFQDMNDGPAILR